METSPQEPLPVKPQLGLWDAVSVIVGIIVGVGIFETPGIIFANVSGLGEALAVWALGGLFAFTGALCFAELASTYPRSGGEYVYLTRAFGPASGFLFAWAQITVIRTGSVATLAYVFADYASHLFQLSPLEAALLATAAIAILSVINILGVTLGTRTQNLLTIAKTVGLLGIIAVGLLYHRADNLAPGPAPQAAGWSLATILVLWTYSGWHEAAYIAMEVRNRRRNLPLALLLGTAAVTLIYLLVNAAIVLALGFEQARAAGPLAPAEVLGLAMGDLGARAMSVLVMVSALGAINGMLFTSSRIYAEMGADHRLFAFLSRWSPRWETPVRSLVVQAVISVVMALAVGLKWRRDGFEMMATFTAAVFWLFFLLTAAALVVLRFVDPKLDRPFRVPLYPLVPLLFAAGCAYMLFGSIQYAPYLSLIGLGILLAGVPVYLWSAWYGPKRNDTSTTPEVVKTRAGE